jgi:hypothetical protein
VPQCGGCTINADCCAGETCIVGQGMTRGTCGPCNPPSDAGTPDSGAPGDSGTPPDGGAPPDSGSTDGGAPGPDASDAGSTCALYGQQCTVNADCCNGVPCTAGRCTSP